MFRGSKTKVEMKHEGCLIEKVESPPEELRDVSGYCATGRLCPNVPTEEEKHLALALLVRNNTLLCWLRAGHSRYLLKYLIIELTFILDAVALVAGAGWLGSPKESSSSCGAAAYPAFILI